MIKTLPYLPPKQVENGKGRKVIELVDLSGSIQL